MAVEEYQSLIERIVQEKGAQAIPKLLELLTDENEEVREIVLQTIHRFGDEAKQILLKKFREKLAESTKNDVLTLYLVDILSDMGEKSIKKDLYQLLNKYDYENAQIVIYEALAKLGDGEKVIDILSYLMLEDEYRTELAEQVAMALSHIPTAKALDCLVKAYQDEQLKGAKPFILKAIAIITLKDQQLWDHLQKISPKNLIGDIQEFIS
ncbi:HEAT repeat domain-containing protein [Pseudothermotoga sp. U03pept]|uniref:HEAT repeat domain-containing protein n=1 Tax=Pseudothermotoga sp. U03pept TaxID=3447012 RepID=UPI003F0EA304